MNKGRPKKNAQVEKTEVVHLRLPAAELKEYKRQAKADDRSLSSYLRRLISVGFQHTQEA